MNFFISTYLFNSPSILNSSVDDESLYMSNIISGIAYASSTPIVYALTFYFTRKNANWMLVTCGIVLVFLMTVDIIKNINWLNQAIFFGYRLTVSAYIQMVYIINY